MHTISADRLKTRFKIPFLLFAEAFHLLRSTDLCHRYFADILLQPVHKLCQSNAIFDMGLTDIFNLYRVLDGLRQQCQILLIYLFRRFRHSLKNCVIQSRAVINNCLILCQLRNILINVIVFKEFYTGPLQCFSVLIFKIICIRVKSQTVCTHHQISQNNRIVLYIIAPEIQKPCNIIQGSQHKPVRFLLCHRLTNDGNSVLS